MTRREAIEVLERVIASEGVPLMRLQIMQIERIINMLIDEIKEEDDLK